LIPFIRIEAGKTSEGIEVSQSRKFSLMSLGRFSNIFSKMGMKEGAKWQFYSKIQFPSSKDCFIIFSASSL
jgi:hypothetical protein